VVELLRCLQSLKVFMSWMCYFESTCRRASCLGCRGLQSAAITATGLGACWDGKVTQSESVLASSTPNQMTG